MPRTTAQRDLRWAAVEGASAERRLAVVGARRRRGAERREIERGRRAADQRFESAFDNAPIGMALVDMRGRWLLVNDALCRITGYVEEELRATTLPSITHPEDVRLDARELQQLVAGGSGSYQVEKRYRHAWGHYIWVLLTVSLVRDSRGRARYAINQVQDISERKELARRLEYIADHDLVTGLFNRRRFERELARESERVGRRNGQRGAQGAVLLIDLDHFKRINDSYGHKAGDDVLRAIAALLRQRVRQTDTLARIGGDEFALLLPQTGPAQAELVAAEIVRSLSRELALVARQSIRVSSSVGLAMFDGPGDSDVLARADAAMYEAKQAGRGGFTPYRLAKARHVRRVADQERLHAALEHQRLLLYLQPILELRTGEVRQYEVLLRFPGGRGGVPLPPRPFLELAERTGLMRTIDAWVIRQSIAMIARHARLGRRLVLSVNLAAQSAVDPRLAPLVEKALQRAAVDPACLIFELTEAALVASLEQVRNLATRLRRLGCQFALDDFGAGFGSLYCIRSLPFDYLKIDGDLIRGLAGSTLDQVVVQAIVDVARGMGKRTVAEFVADAETLRLLEKMGVDFAQGHQIARPARHAQALRPFAVSAARNRPRARERRPGVSY
jgi:diguanylate cyclase (GGDEF)-like protein/PAS domain S-box-containing protein